MSRCSDVDFNGLPVAGDFENFARLEADGNRSATREPHFVGGCGICFVRQFADFSALKLK